MTLAIIPAFWFGGFIVTYLVVEGSWHNKLVTAAIWPLWIIRCWLLS